MIDTTADNFGIGPGLEVSIRWAKGEQLLLTVKSNDQVFESYSPRDVSQALQLASYLIRGSQPPRDLFLCRDTPAR